MSGAAEACCLLQQMLDVAENCDETGYVTDVGFVDVDKLHREVKSFLSNHELSPRAGEYLAEYELARWRALGARVNPLIEAALCAAPESGAEVRDLLEIQHELVELLRLPANNQTPGAGDDT